MQADKHALAPGVMAGIVGATVLALWYLVLDLIEGAPLRTPTFLARAFLGPETPQVGAGLVLFITLVTYAVFILLGILTAWILMAVPRASPLLIGSVVGFLLFDLLFYAAVVVTGGRVADELGWPSILAGNVVAGLATAGTLSLLKEGARVSWWQALRARRPVWEGLKAGLLGAVVVAAWFLLVDSLRGQPLLTPAALGSVVFMGARSMGAISLGAGTVIGYTLLHVMAFLALGVGASLVLDRARRTPHLVVAALLLFIVSEAVIMGLVAIVAQFLLGALAWWAIAAGNGLAAVIMGHSLLRYYPEVKDVISGRALGW